MNNTIESLALLKVNLDHLQRDYLESFIPFLATLMRKRGYRKIEPPRLCEDFRREFGFVIPYHPMIILLERARRRNLIRRDHGNLIPVADKIIAYDFGNRLEDQLRRRKKALLEFIAFCQRRYAENLTEEETESALISFLRSHDLDILFASQGDSVLPEVTPPRTHRYMFASFARHVRDSDPELFQFFVDSAMGHVVASLLLYGSELAQFQGRLRNLNLYLDTRLILRLHGVEGDVRKTVCADLLENLRGQGAELFLFRHTRDEIMEILNNCHIWIQNPHYDPSRASLACRHFMESGAKKSDVQRCIDSLDQLLTDYDINEIDPPTSVADVRYQIDEEKLQKNINTTYARFDPLFEELEKEETILRDIRSIAAIHRLRRGNRPASIRKAGHVFVTANSGLAWASRRFEMSEWGNQFFIPVCLTEVFVGTLVWLQAPVQVAAMDERKFIAQCYASLQPSRVLLKRFVDQVEKLRQEERIDEEACFLLRTSTVAREMLSEKTMGDPNRVTHKTPVEILEEMTDAIRRKENEKYSAEKKKHAETTEELRKVKVRLGAVETNAEAFAERISKVVGQTLFAALVAVLGWGFLVQVLPDLLSHTWPARPSFILTLALAVVSVVFGTNVRNLRGTVERWVRIWIIRRLKARKPDVGGR